MALKRGIGTRDYKEVHTCTGSVPISIGGGDQTVAAGARGVHANIDGTLICRLVGDDADSTWVMVAGVEYALSPVIIRQTGTTVTGNVMY